MTTSDNSQDNIHIGNVDKNAAVAAGRGAQASVTNQTANAAVTQNVGENSGMVIGVQNVISSIPTPRPGSAPPVPSLIVGRDDDLRELKTRVGVASNTVQVLTAIRGWPGIGKTTLAAALAHDTEIAQQFPDGILWVSLGPDQHEGKLISALATWGRALGSDEVLRARTLDEASAQLRGLLRNQRRLLIVDDVWDGEHAGPFNVGGRGCALLVTTRDKGVAQTLAPNAEAVYTLKGLSEEQGLELLRQLAPMVVVQYPDVARELVRELEGLPLALQVAGHMLNVEAGYGFGVRELLDELRDEADKRKNAKIMGAPAPASRIGLEEETTFTIAALFQKSTDRLDEQTRDYFAFLGVFAPKPATFDLAAIKAVWDVEDPKPMVRTLVDRGLLEFVPELVRYQLHALLVTHAKSLVTED